MATMRIERAKVGWRVWLGWVLASVASVAITLTVTGAMVRAGSLNAAVVWAVFGLVIGASLGITQWVVLRQQVSRAYVWVLISIAGFAVGLSAGEAVGFAVGGAVGWPVGGTIHGIVVGAITGAALVWLLRQPVPER